MKKLMNKDIVLLRYKILDICYEQTLNPFNLDENVALCHLIYFFEKTADPSK